MVAATPKRTVAVYTDVSPEEDVAPGVSLLRSAGLQVRVLSTADTRRIAANTDADFLLVGYSRVGPELLACLPRLRGVATRSVGTDMVDTRAAAARGVHVGHLPDVATEEVATHTVALALAAVRGVVFFDRATMVGRWEPSTEVLRRPSLLTWGVVGLGRIGRAVADRARHLVGDVVGFDPALDARAWPSGVERATALAALLGRADIVSLHLPLTEETAGLIGSEQFAVMKPGTVLINVARGGVVDETALLEALDRGLVDAAALDVLRHEPPAADDPLLKHPRTIVTPHVAYLSRESAAAAVRAQAQQVLRWVDEVSHPGKTPT
ncbi:C-terminal binding protein [Egicoccus sp. AB-alg2]|uniref:C-terminal binding protein n=1 Tax=Egicoccus sp. AB-alg2 TaxID=3242693 RepID=UPI00359DD5A8